MLRSEYLFLQDQIKTAIEKSVAGSNLELVDVDVFQTHRRVLIRVYVDRAGGVTVGECAEINRSLSRLFDIENLIEESYLLEVSSPGMARPLKTDRDLIRNNGKLVRVMLKEKINNQTEYLGRLNGVDDQFVMLEQAETVSKLPKEFIYKIVKEVEFK